MKCLRCSAELPAQSQFCLRCGTPIANTAANPAGVMTPPASSPAQNRPLLATIAVLFLAVLGLGAYVLRGQLTQKAGQTDGGRLVQQPGTMGGGALVQAPGRDQGGQMVQAPGNVQPGKIVQAPDTPAPVPVDVIDYLAFLKQVEASKQALIRKQTGDALVMMAQAKALNASIEDSDYSRTFGNLSKGMSYSADDWNRLTQQLQQRNPPPACRELHARYYDHLGKTQAMILAVNDAMSKFQSDPSSALHDLSGMQGKSSADLDVAIQKADDALADVCNRFRLRKDFDVRGDSGSSGLLR